jgi:hypothetical protein
MGQQPPMLGQNMMQPPQGQPQGGQPHGHHGFNPAFLMGMLPGLMAGGGLKNLWPMFGLAGFGAHKGLFK